MADGYARVSGRVAAALVVPGPGLCNAASGLLTATATSSPMLVVTGTRPASAAAGRNLSNELAKWVARPQNPGEVATCVRTAVEQAQRRRPQPVIIEISQEILAASASVDWGMPSRDSVDPASGVVDPDAEAVREAALILSRAQKPVLWAGAGVHRSGVTRELQVLAEKLSAPVVTTRGGKGAISDRHPLSLGYAEARYTPLTEWLASRDAAAVLTALAGELCERTADHAGSAAIFDEVRRLNRTRFDPGRQLQPQWDLMQTIRTVMPDDGILVQGMNQLGYYSRNYYPVYEPRSYLTSSTESTWGAPTRSRWEPNSEPQTGPSSRCAGMGIFCTMRRKWRPPCSTVSAPWPSSSTTTPTATSCGHSWSSSADASSARGCTTRTSWRWLSPSECVRRGQKVPPSWVPR